MIDDERYQILLKNRHIRTDKKTVGEFNSVSFRLNIVS